jgi:hypothetical protein
MVGGSDQTVCRVDQLPASVASVQRDPAGSTASASMVHSLRRHTVTSPLVLRRRM